MRLRIEREAFADAVTWVARALPSRPVIPILAGMLLEAGEGRLTLSCFDYEVSARMSADAAVAEPGRALVSGRLLAEIARSLPAQGVDLASDGDVITLSCGNARFTLLGLPVADFPSPPQPPPAVGVVDGSEFATAVSQVAVAAGRDDTLPMLTGVLVEIDGTAMTLVATDRYRMGVRELGWRPASAGIRASALVPARTLAEAAKSMTTGTDVAISLVVADPAGAPSGTEGGSTGHVDAPDGLIGFDGGDRRLTTRLLGTEFVTYKSRFPREFRCSAHVAVGLFGEVIRRVALVADRDSRLLLTFGADRLVIETGSADGSRAVETIDAEFEGEEGFAIAFKPQYLLDGIGAAAAAQARPSAASGSDGVAAERAAPGERRGSVTLQFTAPDKPAVITGGEGYKYLLAPMRT